MGCVCQECGREFKVDLNIPNRIWEKIKPAGKDKGAGLLCGSCIMNKIESFGEYGFMDVDEDSFNVLI